MNQPELRLYIPTRAAWTDAVMRDFDHFLLDHAAAEKKASGMAMSMVSHYPDKPALVKAMVDLAIEEMTHFREVVKLITERGLQLAPDTKDNYVNALRKLIRKDSEQYLLDRLLLGGIIEARGCERFSLVAAALTEPTLKQFYHAIAESERRHHELFVQLACDYFDRQKVSERLDNLLQSEAAIVNDLPITAALH